MFPSPTANRHAAGLGKLHDVWHGQSLPYSHLPLNDALPGSRSFRVGRLPLVRQRQQQCCCSLIYKLPVFRRSGAVARWSRLHTPVETGTPPNTERSRFCRYSAQSSGLNCNTPRAQSVLQFSEFYFFCGAGYSTPCVSTRMDLITSGVLGLSLKSVLT